MLSKEHIFTAGPIVSQNRRFHGCRWFAFVTEGIQTLNTFEWRETVRDCIQSRVVLHFIERAKFKGQAYTIVHVLIFILTASFIMNMNFRNEMEKNIEELDI